MPEINDNGPYCAAGDFYIDLWKPVDNHDTTPSSENRNYYQFAAMFFTYTWQDNCGYCNASIIN